MDASTIWEKVLEILKNMLDSSVGYRVYIVDNTYQNFAMGTAVKIVKGKILQVHKQVTADIPDNGLTGNRRATVTETITNSLHRYNDNQRYACNDKTAYVSLRNHDVNSVSRKERHNQATQNGYGAKEESADQILFINLNILETSRKVM